MSSTVISLPANFQDAKLLMDLIVGPALDLIRSELHVHTDQMTKTASQLGAVVSSFDGRISRLESNQKKALVGWGVLASAGLGLIAVGWTKVKGLFHLN